MPNANEMFKHFTNDQMKKGLEEELLDFKTILEAQEQLNALSGRGSNGGGSMGNYANGTAGTEPKITREDFTAFRKEFDEYKRLSQDKIRALQEHVVMIDRDIIMESQHEELKAAWEAYDELLSRLRTFNALRDSA